MKYNFSSAEITARLRDFIKAGYNLPADLDEIEIRANYTLKNAFIERFNLREIGFESYIIFNERLNERAKSVIAFYKPIYLKQVQLLNVNDFTKVTKAEYTGQDFLNDYGTAVTNDDVTKQVKNENIVTDDLNKNDEYLKLQNNFNNLVDKMLNEFECLFIGIY